MADASTGPLSGSNSGGSGGATHSSPAKSSSKTVDVSPPKRRLYLSPAPWFGTYLLPKAVQSKPYDPQTITVDNGAAPYSFAISTDWQLDKILDLSHRLPPGLELSKDGTISGTPKQGGTYEFKVEATDAKGITGSCYYSIAVELDLNHYLAHFDSVDGTLQASEPIQISRFEPDANGANGMPLYPLSLCEFLSYKAAQAYLDDDPNKPKEGLRALLENSHPDSDIIRHYRFFDSRKALKRYSADEIAKLGTVPDDKAPDHWNELDAKQIKRLNERRKALDTQAFGFVFEGRAYIVCRGTSSIEDARVDIDNGLTTDPPERTSRLQTLKHAVGLRSKKVVMTEEEKILIGGPDPENFLKPARSVGFAAAWAAVRDQVENWIETLPAQFRQEFVFSGHSLGGALAFVGAHEFADKRNRRIHAVVTFGAPCVGMSSQTTTDKTIPHFVDSYHQLQGGELESRTIRLETSSDAVPRLMQVKNFSHVGRDWQVEFPPLPDTFTLVRRKFVTGPLMYVGRAMLRGGETSWSAAPRKALGYAIIYGLPLARKVLAAHSADSRYALFLSTLAYRKIRRAHIGDLSALDPKTDTSLGEKYSLANKVFQDHLARIAGKSLTGIKTPRTIGCPKTELSYGRKYYGSANAQYLF